MPMTCLTDLEIIAFLEGDLPSAARPIAERHLDTCALCFNIVAAMGRAAAQEADDTEALPGPLLADGTHRYVPGAEIARGGMGRILVGEDRLLGRPVALKLLRRRSTGLARRFLREQRITARLQHPAIVPIYDAGVLDDGEPFFVMRLVKGQSLDRHAARATSLEEQLRLLPAVLGVVDAVAYAHGEGVVHRDLKPQNVLVGPFGEVVVLDWGLARETHAWTGPGGDPDDMDRGDPHGLGTTRDGVMLGTLAYMAPEQAAGHSADARSDVYGLGAILYHVLCGRPPHAERPTSLSSGAALHVPPPLALHAPEVPTDLVAIVTRAMAPEPAARYASAQELAADLKRWQAGRMVQAHRYSTGDLLRRFLTRYRAPLWVAGASLVVLGMLGGIGLQRILAERNRALSEQARAETQRVAAEKLVGFILGDLRPRLSRVGRLDALAAAAQAVLEYQNSAPPADDPATWLRRAEAAELAGDVAMDTGDLTAADESYRRSHQAAIEAGSAEGAVEARCRAAVRLGDVLRRQRQLTAAAEYFQECKALAAVGGGGGLGLREQILLSQSGLAHVAFLGGDTVAARELLEEGVPGAIALMKEAGGPGADVAGVLWQFRALLWTTLDDLEEYRAARVEAQAMTDLAQARVDARPDDSDARHDLARSYIGLGQATQNMGDLDAAEQHYQRGLAESRGLSNRDPSNRAWLRTVGVAAEYMGNLANTRDGPEAALSWYRENDELSARLVALSPANKGFQWGSAIAAMKLASALTDLERYDEARVELLRALEIIERPEAKEMEPSRVLHIWGTALHSLGDLEIKADRAAVGQAALLRAIDLLKRQLAAVDTTRIRLDLACTITDLAESEQGAAALGYSDEALELLKPLRSAEKDNSEITEILRRAEAVRRKAARVAGALPPAVVGD